MATAPRIHAVILAGGAGERFWPASRRHYPKPFLRVVGGQSLLAATLARARRFARGDRVWIVCGEEHAKAIREESGLPRSRILVEPERRNTAMAVAWAAVRIAAEDPEAVMTMLPADHHIPDVSAFAAAIRVAARAARQEGVLVTLGVRPTRPDTGYGYIQLGKPVGEAHPELCLARRFVEKPDLPRARRYLERGDYLWNAGIFVWGVDTLQDEIRGCAPDLHRALAPLRKAPRGRNRDAVSATYRRAPSLPIDVAVMERSKRVWTIPLDFAWSDVGTWASLADELGVGTPAGADAAAPEIGKRRRTGGRSAASGKRNAGRRRGGAQGDEEGNRIVAGNVLLRDARGNLVWGDDRLIALLGVEDLAVIDTDDVTLITKLSSSSDVRKLVAALKQAGRDDLT